MNKKPFGLDIGATSIKLVWLGEQKDGFELKSAIIAPAPPKGLLSESPLDEEEMAQAIRKAASDAGITSNLVNVALTENQVYTKVLEMPVLSDNELNSAIYWEAEQYIPIPLSSITLVWDVLKKPKEAMTNEKMQVLMVGAPTVLINKYEKVLSKAGLTVSALETEILSTVRSLVLEENFPPTLILNIGAGSTSFALIRQGTMVFTYSMYVGGLALNRAIAADFGFSPAQAEEYKRVYGIKGKEMGAKIGKSTEPVLHSILAEVKKLLAYYSQKYKDEEPIRQILLSGGTSKLPGLDMFFTSNSGIETVIANPWKALSSQEVPKEILDNAPDFSIAVGLAMRNYE